MKNSVIMVGGSKRCKVFSVIAFVGFLLSLLIAHAVALNGFQFSWFLENDKRSRVTLAYERCGIMHGVPLRSNLCRLSMGLFNGLWSRVLPRRTIDFANRVDWTSNRAIGIDRRFFDPPTPLDDPNNRTTESRAGIWSSFDSSLPSQQDQLRKIKQVPLTAEDQSTFLVAALQSRNVLAPSYLSTINHSDKQNSLVSSADEKHHQVMLSSPPSMVNETDALLRTSYEDREREKREWVEMVLDPNRYHRLSAFNKSPTQNVTQGTTSLSRSSSTDAEGKPQIESRYSPIDHRIQTKKTFELYSLPIAKTYLGNREAINIMLQRRSFPLRDKKFAGTLNNHSTLDAGATVAINRNPPTSLDSNNLQHILSDEDLRKTRDVIRQFHSSVRSFSETTSDVKKELKTDIGRVAQKMIRMTLPIPDDGNESDTVDAKADPSLSIRDVIEKASKDASLKSQADRSKKWGIDISKF